MKQQYHLVTGSACSTCRGLFALALVAWTLTFVPARAATTLDPALQAALQSQTAMSNSLQTAIQDLEQKIQGLGSLVQNTRADMLDLGLKIDERCPKPGTSTTAFPGQLGANTNTHAICATQAQSASPSTPAIAFTAKTGSDATHHNDVRDPSYYHISYDNISPNVGNFYNTSTKQFEAPVSGVYVVFASASTLHTHSTYVGVMLERTELHRLFVQANDQAATQVVTHMNAGERLWLRLISTSRSSRTFYGSGGVLTVFLLHKD